MKITKKSKKRLELLESIVNSLKQDDIYNVIDYKNQREDRVKQFIYPYLLNDLKRYYINTRNIKEETAYRNAKKHLLWEGNKQTTVNNMMFFGVQHRPDMVINDDLNIAIEVKKGNIGSSIREGIGQSLVYSTLYDFVVYLFIDTSKDKRILNAMKSDKESSFVKKLWNEYNILFEVV